MTPFRKLTSAETAALEALGNSAEDWSKVLVSEDFKPFQLLQSHLEGDVEIAAEARIVRSRVANYRIGTGSLVEGVTALECRRRSAFGNGVGVATMNECGGRTVKIFDRLSAQVAYVMAVYRLIADAESKAHGKSVSEIHFHEVGTMDAIADITAVCLLMHRLAPDEIIVSPVHVGSGQVHCAHGILPVPAPATATILQDVPIYGGSIQGELCTPTGAALLKHFADSFGGMPVMRTSAIGYGMGKKDFPAANCVRALLGERSAASDDVIELCCNIDDMTGEAIGYAFDKLFAAGALDVYTIPIGMKKSRPGHLLHVICREADKDALVRALFAHTTTIGIRENRFHRYTLDRRIETIETADGPVRRKCSTGYGVSREKFEHDDLARIADAHGLNLREAEARIRKQLS